MLETAEITIETKEGKQTKLTLEEAIELHDSLYFLFQTAREKSTPVPDTRIILTK